ncbi:MAG TPA: S53 family peptidase [Mycobacteriales bacterium]|nr:S53 family peptidase [Mycobacteriales bacterium]
MVRFRALAALVAALLLGAMLRPSAAMTPPAEASVRFALSAEAGTAAALHRLAQTPVAGHSRHAVTARRTALAGLAPGAERRSAVVAWAQAHDLTVQRADDWAVTVSGPAPVLAALLATSLSHGRATSALSVPSALRGQVDSVHGLDDRPLLRAHAVPFGLTGPKLRTQYGVPSLGWTGAGVTVGTLNLTGWDPNDLAMYAAAAGTPLASGQITTIAVDNPPNPLVPDGSGNDFEVAMDAQAILAAAPQAKQRMYFAPNNGVGTIDVFDQMATDGQAGLLHVASTSWGLCEPKLPAWYRDAVGQAVDRMLAAGVTLYAAAGDAGMYDCSRPEAVDNTPTVDFPASHPGVVAVGGTRVGLAETAWGAIASSPGTSYAGNGGGGGSSAVYPRPSWQTGLGQSGTTRLVPDVASVADPSTGLGMVNGGSWWLGGGTSLGAPTWAGLTASALSAAGRTTGLGDVHPVLYAHPEAFRDITAGSNGYLAGEGHDLATGLGVPNWTVLGPLLTGTPIVDTAAPTSSARAALLTGTDTRTRFSWTARDAVPSSGLASYDVRVTQVGGTTVWQATETSGHRDLTLTAGRAYVLTVRARDAAGNLGAAATARVAIPYDDAALARSGTWSRRALSGDYRGSHLTSAVRGSRVSLSAAARSLTVGLVKAPTGGYVDVYVDGRRTARLDTWSSTTRVRQQVRLGTWTTTGRHTVVLIVVGGHRAGATGSSVRVDSLTVSPW